MPRLPVRVLLFAAAIFTVAVDASAVLLEGSEGDGEEKGGEEEEEKAETTPFKIATTLFCIMTFLALVTVAFETGKDYLMEEVATRETKPVIAGLFSELTVLGFLSLVTFVVSQTPLLKEVSGHVFGEGEEREGYLMELLEQIHFMIFAVMVIFIFQTLTLLHITKHQFAAWNKCQAICSGDNANKSKDLDQVIDWLSQEERGSSGLRGCYNWFKGRSKRHREMLDLLRFDAMREEFLNPRSQFPPFDCIPSEKLPENFDYSRYMQRQLTDFLVEIIEVPVTTWLTIGLLTAGFCGAMIATEDQPHVLAWGWCLFGWCLNLLQGVYQRHLTWTLSMCGNRKYLRRPRLAPWFSRLLPGTELQVLVKDVKPGWTSLDLPDPAVRTLWEKLLFGIAHVPNRQQLLFPMRAHGKVANEFLARLYVLAQTVYCSLLAFTFWPIMAKRHAAFGTEHLVLYAVLSLYPLYTYASTLGGLVQSVVEVNALRVFKPSGVISSVLRDQKAERAIKAIMLLNNMRSRFDGDKEKIDAMATGAADFHLSAEKRKEIEETFDVFDTDKGGEIDSSEFRELMASLGVNLTDDQAREKLQILDSDHSGTISKEEFVAWHSLQLHNAENQKETSVEELVDQLFDLFDSMSEDEGSTGGDGVITTSEFKTCLDKFNAGLTDEEVAMLLAELDEDCSGTIDKKEFKEMLEKYATEE